MNIKQHINRKLHIVLKYEFQLKIKLYSTQSNLKI